MDKDVSAGSGITTVAGRLALGSTVLALGLGHTALIDGSSSADAVSIAQYVGGVALFVAGLNGAGLFPLVFAPVALSLTHRPEGFRGGLPTGV